MCKIACAAMAAVLVASLAGVSHAQLVSEDFSADPRGAGWTYAKWDCTTVATGGWSAGGYVEPPAGWQPFWISPSFTVAPYDYFRIELSANGATSVCGVGINTAATWGRYPNANSAGLLVDDDWTTFADTGGWTTQVYYSRARTNAAQSAVRIANGNADNVTVTAATRSEAAAWADSVYAAMPSLNWTPDADRFDRLSRVRAKLLAGQTVTIVCLGDSIMNDTGNSAFDVLLERAYGLTGGAKVQVVTAVGGGTGVDKWNNDTAYNWPSHDLSIQGAVVDQAPDLVMIGGISNGTKYNDFRGLIDKVRAGVQGDHGYAPDILLMTGAFGAGSDATGYAAELGQIAADKQTAFLDLRAIWQQYMSDANTAGYGWDYFYRDWNYSANSGTHANTFGKQILARTLEGYLIPEPASLLLLAIGSTVLLRRRRGL